MFQNGKTSRVSPYSRPHIPATVPAKWMSGQAQALVARKIDDGSLIQTTVPLREPVTPRERGNSVSPLTLTYHGCPLVFCYLHFVEIAFPTSRMIDRNQVCAA